MKHKKISTIWLITGACFLVAIIAWSLSGSKEKETINFTTEPVSLGNIRNSITATGEFDGEEPFTVTFAYNEHNSILWTENGESTVMDYSYRTD